MLPLSRTLWPRRDAFPPETIVPLLMTLPPPGLKRRSPLSNAVFEMLAAVATKLPPVTTRPVPLTITPAVFMR
jgi:hypothetical protein